jgi:hypothetical protein
MAIPMIRASFWKQLVFRFQSPNPYITKKLGLQRTPLGLITDYVQFQLTQEPQLVWVVNPPSRLFTIHPDQCPSCLCEHLLLDSLKGLSICSECGYIVDENVATNCTSYQESHGGSLGVFWKSKFPRHLTVFHTKRTNHFKYWLQRLQGKEVCRITGEELARLRGYLQDRDIDYELIRKGLKALGLQRYYPNSYYLVRHFTGKPLVEFTSDHESQLVEMFLLIQSAFTQHAGTRVNMISYTYLIRKFSELLGWEDVVWSIPSMKSDANIHRQDVIWKLICRDVGFTYYRSVL